MTDLNYVHVTAYMKVGEDYDGYSERTALPSVGEWTVEDSGTIAADDGDFDFPYRQITAFAFMDAATLETFRSEWSIDAEDATPAMGFLGAVYDNLPRLYDDERHTADGMDWNVGGVTAVMWVDISIIGPEAVPA
jgi:hypothetical protein